MSPPDASIDPVARPFQGTWEHESKIVIGVDIGSTQSGVAFTFLQKDGAQTIHRVTQWPGQEGQTQQSKVPTLVWYDLNGKAVSFGAEALLPQTEDDAEDNNWRLAKHFKLHLHPNSMKNNHGFKLQSLPDGVSLHQIYSDFLGYLLKHVQGFFEDRIIDGKLIWETYHSRMEVIIAHPNGWGIREQTFLRAAAVDAVALSTTATSAASCKIRFVTEAEASVHFCIYHTALGGQLQPRTKFAVCDAGGSTVDTTVYSVVAARPTLKLEEVRASACVQAGGIFVDAAAEAYLRTTLANASLAQTDVDEYVIRGIKDFESIAKRSFRDVTEDKPVEIAGPRFNNPTIRTRRGRMSLPGTAMKSFFDVCVDEITASVDQQIQGANVSYLLLVGGFGDSQYLRQEFVDRYGPQGCKVTLTNESSSKAVADGAVIWSTIDSVVGRAVRSSFGIEVAVRYNSSSPEFRGRDVFVCPSGQEKVPGGWSQIVGKGVVLDPDAVIRECFSEAFSSPNPDLGEFKISLISYSENGAPRWVKDKKDMLESGFQRSCTITASLVNLSGALEPRIGAQGSMYWRLYFDVCIRFGGTELEAYLEWEEKGDTRRGGVFIIPDEPV